MVVTSWSVGKPVSCVFGPGFQCVLASRDCVESKTIVFRIFFSRTVLPRIVARFETVGGT